MSLWVIQCVNSHSEAISLIWVVKSENHPIMAALLFVHILIQNDQFSFPDMESLKDLNGSAVVLLVGNKGAHNIPHAYPPKIYIYHIKTSIIALLSTLVDLSTWIVYHGDSLTLSNSSASISSAISSIHLGLVVVERGLCTTL